MKILKKLWNKFLESTEKHPILYSIFLLIFTIIILFNGSDKHIIEIILLGIIFVSCCFVLFIKVSIVILEKYDKHENNGEFVSNAKN